MRHIEKRSQPRRESSVGALIAALAMGCSATIGETNGGMSSQGGGSKTTGTGTGGGSDGDPSCSETGATAAKRIVRLSFNQIANSIGGMIDAAFGTKLITDFQLVDSEHRAFPPLQSPREGNSLTDQSWNSISIRLPRPAVSMSMTTLRR